MYQFTFEGVNYQIKFEHTPENGKFILSETFFRPIGGRSRRALLNLKALHRDLIFAIENHLSLAKWPPLLLVPSSA